MKVPCFFKLPNFCLLLSVLCSSAPAAVTVLDYYRLGEDDPGAFNGGDSLGTTRDSVGTRDLALSGGPFWSTDVSPRASITTASVFFDVVFPGGAIWDLLCPDEHHG